MESTLFTTLTVTEEASLSGGTKTKGYKEYKVKKYSPSKYLDLNVNIIKNTVSQTNVIADVGDVDKIEQKNSSNITNVIV